MWAFIIQIVLCAIYWTALDMGQRRHASASASAIFWLGVVLILVRRSENPTRGDLAFIRWALLPIGVLGCEFILLVRHMRGA